MDRCVAYFTIYVHDNGYVAALGGFTHSNYAYLSVIWGVIGGLNVVVMVSLKIMGIVY